MHRVVRNAITLFTGNVGSSAIGFVAFAITARALGPREFGILILIHTYAFIVGNIFGFKSWQAIVRFGSEYVERGEESKVPPLIKAGVLLDAAAAIGATVAINAGLWLIGPRLELAPEIIQFGFIYSLTALTNVSSASTGVLRLFDRVSLISWHSVVSSFIKLVCVGVAWNAQATLASLLSAWVVAGVLSNLLALLLMSHELYRQGLLRTTLSARVGQAREDCPHLLKFLAASNVDGTVKMGRELDAPIVAYIAGPEAAGLFKVARQITTSLVKAADPVYYALYPDMIRMAAKANFAGLRKAALSASKAMGAGALAAYLLYVVLGKELLLLFFGPQYLEVYPLGLAILPAFFVWCLTIPLIPMAHAINKYGQALLVHVAATALYLALSALLTRHFGLVATAAAYSVFYGMWCLGLLGIVVINLRRRGGLPSNAVPTRSLGPADENA